MCIRDRRKHVEDQFVFTDYNPFDLVMIDAKQIVQLSWNGRISSWQEHHAPCFFTSSSLRPLEIIAERQAHFTAWLELDGKASLSAKKIIEQLHWAEGRDPETAIRMRRAQTHSKSICQVSLASSTLTLCYWNEATLNQREPGALMGAGECVNFPVLT